MSTSTMSKEGERLTAILAAHRVASEMEDLMSEEPQTPKEIAEHKVSMAVRDCWLAIGDICKLRNDPIAAPFVEAHEVDLWSIQTQVALVLSDIETSREPKPKLKVVSNG